MCKTLKWCFTEEDRKNRIIRAWETAMDNNCALNIVRDPNKYNKEHSIIKIYPEEEDVYSICFGNNCYYENPMSSECNYTLFILKNKEIIERMPIKDIIYINTVW